MQNLFLNFKNPRVTKDEHKNNAESQLCKILLVKGTSSEKNKREHERIDKKLSSKCERNRQV